MPSASDQLIGAAQSDLISRLADIVGPDQAAPASPSDAVREVQPLAIAEPGDEREVARLLALADEIGAKVLPRGGGTKMRWGNRPSVADFILSTRRLDRIVDHAWADMTVTVDAGVALAHLQRTLAEHGQRLAVDVLWPAQATIGGILATNESGVLRLRYGGLRDLVIGITLALPDGTLARSGGKVVKNVAGYDLPKLATGALGTLGVITQATFRLHPLPKLTRTLTLSASSLEEAQAMLLAIQDSILAHAALQMRADPGSASLDVLLEGTEAGIVAQERMVRDLAGPGQVTESPLDVWDARQRLFVPASGLDATALLTSASAPSLWLAKLSVLPNSIAPTIAMISERARAARLAWGAVVQATGLGWCRLGGEPDATLSLLLELRREIEHGGGSLFVLSPPGSAVRFDAWGSAGDAAPVMRAIKHQLDPRGTLNPGRFVEGI